MTMAPPAPKPFELVDPADPRLHPALSDKQLDAVARFASCREFAEGDVMFEQGQRDAPFIIVKSGRADIYENLPGGDRRVIAHVIARRFIGDLSMFTGQPTLAECVAAEPCEALVMDREALRRLIAENSEVGDIIFACLIARREWLLGNDLGLAKLIGSRWSDESYRLRDFLARNQVPFRYLDAERDDEAAALLEQFDIAPDDLPVLVCAQGVCRHPSIEQLARRLGFKPRLDEVARYDLVVIGGGPAGLAAAVYGGSEGLSTLVCEADSPGGQAGTSSKIENYLGFPTGVSGQELADRAVLQARKFGVMLSNPTRVASIVCEGEFKQIELEGGERLEARAVVIATGADYRRLKTPGCAELDGKGVYYGASHTEAVQCTGERVVVIGGGNSAGQAAVNLAQHADHVSVVIRRGSLHETMSRYLVDRIDRAVNIELITESEADEFLGEGHLETLVLRHTSTGERRRVATKSVFVMIGAEPRTCWLSGCVGLDGHGFIPTGTEAKLHPAFAKHWSGGGEPSLLETTRPGIFAVGDVRAGSIKRVASAVGEGAMAVKLVHTYLA